MASYERSGWTTGRITGIVIAVLVLFGGGFLWESTAITVPANEIIVKQNAIDGKLQFWINPGLENKAFGKVTHYNKSSQYSFSAATDVGSKDDQSIKIRFADSGHGYISGTLRWELPTDDAHLSSLHSKFGSQANIEQELIRPIIERSMFISGSLMTSKESSAAKKSDLFSMIEDQIINGVYKTTSEEVIVKDTISNQDRTEAVVKLVKDPLAPNGFARVEASPLTAFGIKVYSFNISALGYDPDIEKQMALQQDLVAQVQTSMGKARQAEQEKLTVEQTGLTNVEKAKYEAEVEKQKAVTQGEEKVAVATLSVKAAELYKQEQTLLGEGDASRRSKAMAADGQLDKKLDAWLKAQQYWANAVAGQTLVPEIQMGSSAGGSNAVSAAQTLMDLTALRTAKDLQLDYAPGSKGKTAKQ